MPTNRAAWQDKAGTQLSIRDTPYPDPTSLSPTQILLKAHAWAINPCDIMIQDSDSLPFISYPLILGEDAAGTVFSAGTTASARFKPNDRILAMTLGSGVKKPEMGGFQEYVIVESQLACHIPDSMSFAEASVFPLCITTPSHGLFSKDFLALDMPPLPLSNEPIQRTGKSVLIWGGSSAVGSNAIQLAKAAGLEVFATSSPRNFSYLRSLGASQVFGYSSPSIIPDLVKLLDATDCAGIFHAAGSVEHSLQISYGSKQDLFVASATAIPEQAKVPEGVSAKMVFGVRLEDLEIAPMIFGEFLPQALKMGVYKVAPEPLVVGRESLEGLQEGFEVLRKGVSARKVVVVAE